MHWNMEVNIVALCFCVAQQMSGKVVQCLKFHTKRVKTNQKNPVCSGQDPHRQSLNMLN